MALTKLLGSDYELDLQSNHRGTTVTLYHIANTSRVRVLMLTRRSDKLTVCSNDVYVKAHNIQHTYNVAMLILKVEMKHDNIVYTDFNSMPKYRKKTA